MGKSAETHMYDQMTDTDLIRTLRDALETLAGYAPAADDHIRAAEIIAAADARLEQQAPESIPSTEIRGSGTPNTAPESGEQPVAWADPETLARCNPASAIPATLAGRKVSRFTTALYTRPAPSPAVTREMLSDERLAEVLTEAYGSPEWTMDDVRAARAVGDAILSGSAPEQRELTDEEIDGLYINGIKTWIGKRDIARAAIAADRKLRGG